MTDSGGERIGGIVGLGRFFEPQQRLDHELHLLFRRRAVARDRRFYLQRRIFEKPRAQLGARKQYNAARLRDLYARRDIGIEKQFLYRDLVGLDVADEFFRFLFYERKPLGGRKFCGRFDRAVVKRDQLPVVVFYYAVPDYRIAGILIYRSFSVLGFCRYLNIDVSTEYVFNRFFRAA